MKRLLPALLVLLIAGTALGQYEVKFVPGQHTVVYQSTVGQFSSVATALERAWQSDTTGTVTFAGPGNYDFESSYATLSGSRRSLVIPQTVTLVAGSGTYGIAAISGDYVTVTGGGRILVDSAVNDQNILYFTGDRGRVENITFKSTTTSAINTNPMVFVGALQVQGLQVNFNRFIPLRAFTCFKSTAGMNNTFHGNEITPNEQDVYEASDNEITGSSTTTTYLGEFWRVVDLQHDGWARVTNNRCRFMGRPVLQGDAFINYTWLDEYSVETGGTNDLNEAGHLQVIGNYVEDTIAPCYIRLNGCRWGQIIGNSFANSLSGIATASEAAIIVDVGDETTIIAASTVVDAGNTTADTYTLSSGSWTHTPTAGERIYVTGFTEAANNGWKTVATADADEIEVSETLSAEAEGDTVTIFSGYPSDDILISGNQFHNVPFSGQVSGDILLGHCFRVHILANHFSNNLGEYSINIEDGDFAKDFSVIGNVFEGKAWFLGGENQPTSPIHFVGGSTAARYVLASNAFSGYSSTFVTKTASVTGQVYDDGVDDATDLTYSATTISAANTDNSINDTATGFPAFAAGDIILISGFTGTAANNRVAVVVSRTTAKIVVSNLNGNADFVDDAADGETVTIRKLFSAGTDLTTNIKNDQ